MTQKTNNPKNIQDVVAEKVEETKNRFYKRYSDKVYPKKLTSIVNELSKDFTTTLTQLVKEVEAGENKKRDALYQEINVKKLLGQMEEDLLEYGQYHDPECQQMSEWADPDSECDCETIKAMRSFAIEWVGKANEMWVNNLKEHRKHCTPDGNKDLTNRKRKVLAFTPPTSDVKK